MDTNEERQERPAYKRFRTISGIFDRTADEVKQSASEFQRSVVVPAYGESKKYMDEKPVQATFIAIFTILAFFPILLFIIFVVSAVLLVAFSAVSTAFGASTLAIIGAAAVLLGLVGICIAPATLVLTMIVIISQHLYRLLCRLATRAGVILPSQGEAS